MRIAVTGGCGFIGSHIVDLLITGGHEVSVFDNLTSGSMENLNAGAELYTGDITNRTELDSFFRHAMPEAVCHHAAQIDVQTSMKNPAFDAMVNIMGTVNLLDMCGKYNTRRFIFASSAAIYGNPEYLGVDEKHPKNPESFYGYSKLTAETYIRMYCEKMDMTYGILRYANVYGPRQKAEGEGGVVAIFTDRMIKEDDCVIFGNGEQTRDFIYVKDIAKANAAALEAKTNFTVNVGTSAAIGINELFNILKKQYKYSKNPLYRPARLGDILNSYLSNDKITGMLDWIPAYNLKEGIKEMAKTYDDKQKHT